MKPKVLIVSKRIPYPLLTGGDQAQFNLLKGLQDIFDIYLVYNAGNHDRQKKARDTFLQLCSSICVLPYHTKESKLNGIHFLCSLLKSKIASKLFLVKKNNEDKIVENYLFAGGKTYDRHPSSFLQFIVDCVNKYKINILQIEFNANIDLIFGVPSTVKTIFIHHEIQFIRNLRYLEQRETNKDIYWYWYRLLKTAEIGMLNQYDEIVVFSHVDKELLLKNGVVKNVEVSVPTVALPDRRYDTVIKNNLLTFVGPSIHSPNVDGLHWFLTQVWPLIIKKNPLTELQVIGVWDIHLSETLTKKYKGIRFLGFVEDLGEAISGTVMVVPVLIGSGVRMKILEAANHGIPVISTQVGIEGLDFTNGLNALISDNPDEFANSVIAVLSDGEQRSFLANNAHLHFIKNFSLETVIRNRQLLLNKLFTNEK